MKLVRPPLTHKKVRAIENRLVRKPRGWLPITGKKFEVWFSYTRFIFNRHYGSD